MKDRIELNEALCKVLGSRNVYFNGPGEQHMKYPCIRYRLSGLDTKHADNVPYHLSDEYEITVIDFDPDSKYFRGVAQLPRTSFSTSYTAEGLYHWVFMITL